MMYPLEEPNGWFLSAARHKHEREGDHYIPLQMAEGPWYVTFQRTTGAIATVTGPGFTLEQAWANATEKVAKLMGENF